MKPLVLRALLLVLCVLGHCRGDLAWSLDPQLLMDINARGVGANPGAVVQIGSSIVFVCRNQARHVSICSLNGSVLNFAKDLGWVVSENMEDLNGIIYYHYYLKSLISAGSIGYFLLKHDSNSTSQYDLWRTDGTEVGTFMLHSFPKGMERLAIVTDSAGRALITGSPSNGDTTTLETWLSDGTVVGTVRLAPYNTSQGTSPIVRSGSFFYKVDYDWPSVSELYRVAAGSSNAALVWSGPSSWGEYLHSSGPGIIWEAEGQNMLLPAGASTPLPLSLWGSTQFVGEFQGDAIVEGCGDSTGVLNCGLYRIQSSGVATFLTQGRGFQVSGQKIFFYRGDYGSELTVLSSNGQPGNATTIGTFGDLSHFTAVGDTGRIAIADRVSNYDYELETFSIVTSRILFSDGTPGGTSQLMSKTSASKLDMDEDPVNLGDRIIFAIYAGPGEVNTHYLSDGTVGGTVEWGAMSGGSVVGKDLYFPRTNASGSELWRLSAGSSTPVQLTDVIDGTGSSYPYGFTAMGNLVLFSAFHPEFGTELWRTDGTLGGTIMLKDIYEGPWNDSITGEYSRLTRPLMFMTVNNRLVFGMGGGNYPGRSGLWSSDGTSAGTVMIREMDGYSLPSSEAYSLGTRGAIRIYAKGTLGSSCYQLLGTDGTPNEVSVLLDSCPQNTSIHYFETAGVALGKLFLAVNRQQVYLSDGTVSGTGPLVNIPNLSSVHLVPMAGAPVGRAAFRVHLSDPEEEESLLGTQFFLTDGTPGGTAPVSTIIPSRGTTGNVWLPDGTSRWIVYTARDHLGNPSTWKLDVTTQQATLIANGVGITSALPVGNTLIFFNEAVANCHLWVTDGTTGGTHSVFEIPNGKYCSFGTDPSLGKDTIVINVTEMDGTSVRYQTDGTAMGTTKIPSQFSGVELRNLTQIGDSPIFVGAGYHPTFGDELFVVSTKDECPNDANKSLPGVCGCGHIDADDNGNGIFDCFDLVLAGRVPAKPKLKQVKKKVVVTMQDEPAADYVIKITTTPPRVGTRKVKAKVTTTTVSGPVFTMKAPKVGSTVKVSYHFVLSGDAKAVSEESKTKSIKIKTTKK